MEPIRFELDEQYSFSLRNIDKKRGSQNNIHDLAASSSLSNYQQLDKTIQKNMQRINTQKHRRTPSNHKSGDVEMHKNTEECLESTEREFNKF